MFKAFIFIFHFLDLHIEQKKKKKRMAENAMFFLTNFLSICSVNFTFKKSFCGKPWLKTTLLHVYTTYVYREAVLW